MSIAREPDFYLVIDINEGYDPDLDADPHTPVDQPRACWALRQVRVSAPTDWPPDASGFFASRQYWIVEIDPGFVEEGEHIRHLVIARRDGAALFPLYSWPAYVDVEPATLIDPNMIHKPILTVRDDLRIIAARAELLRFGAKCLNPWL